ncbi:hypothetical protein [Rhodopirellula baltica]|nr:hypothetical protein [Rhodopirellula baltica]
MLHAACHTACVLHLLATAKQDSSRTIATEATVQCGHPNADDLLAALS